MRKSKRGKIEPNIPAVPPREPLPPLPVELELYEKKPGCPWPDDMRAVVLEYVFSGIASKQTIKNLCAQPKMPDQFTVYTWISADADSHARYRRARQYRADCRADRIDEITEMVLRGEIDANTARVAVDAEKWQASKENRDFYGDQVRVDGDSGNSPAAVIEALSGLVRAISGASRSLLPADNPVLPAAKVVTIGNDSETDAN